MVNPTGSSVSKAADQQNPQLWIESPESRTGPVARVAMIAAVDGEYSFAIPAGLSGPLSVRSAAYINGSVRSYTYTSLITPV